jgi:hypothetical protein
MIQNRVQRTEIGKMMEKIRKTVVVSTKPVLESKVTKTSSKKHHKRARKLLLERIERKEMLARASHVPPADSAPQEEKPPELDPEDDEPEFLTETYTEIIRVPKKKKKLSKYPKYDYEPVHKPKSHYDHHVKRSKGKSALEVANFVAKEDKPK